MPLYISSLNSGSNGNCYYVGNDEEALLIDAGISCAETERRMERSGLSMSMVKAIFISHEHTDHITGVATISKKYKLPVYITDGTLGNSGLKIDKKLINNFHASLPIEIGRLTVTAFKKLHDASDPHSFMVSGENVNIGIFTDIGHPGKELVKYFKQCHAAFLESNYCEDMLENGYYPKYLKKRISGRNGHLSNTQALELFLKHRSKQLTHLILAHLSENNNDPKLVNKIFTPHAASTKIIIASRYKETEVFTIKPVYSSKISKTVHTAKQKENQLSLF